jgi:TonB-linked SusC/RagA family outer membrane protein
MKTKLNGILTLLLVLVVQVAFAQQTITGKVVDLQGEGLFGATVQIKGTNTGVTTDFDGNYSISATPEQTLIFSSVGLTNIEMVVGTRRVINVTLKGSNLDEIVIVAYGSQKKDNIVSSIATISSDKIEQVPIASIDQALQGLAPGVQVSTSSGQPGRRGNVVIRGRGSINGDVNPLYVIDGIPVSPDTFRSLNNNDVETISVLKDAAATAPYGNRASNGVVLITTKRGKFNAPLSVQYRAQTGFSDLIAPQFDVMNNVQYLTYARDISRRGNFQNFTDAEIAATTNANWLDQLTRTGQTLSHEVNFTQGTEATSSFSSISYFNQEGVTNRSELERFTFRNNYTNNSSKRFKYNSQVAISYGTNDFVVDRDRSSGLFGENSGGQLDNPFIVPYLALPFFNPFNADGSQNLIGTQQSGALDANGNIIPDGANGFLNTPYLALNTQRFNTDRETEFKTLGSLEGTYIINDDFKAGARVGLDYTNIQELNIVSPNSIRGLVTPNVDAEFKGSQTEGYIRRFTANVNPYISFDKVFAEKHAVNASANTEYNYTNNQTAFLQAFGLNPALPGSGSGWTDGNLDPFYIPNVGSSEQELALFSAFVLANYNYDGKYGISATVRRDGASRFQEKNRWGTFWSIGGLWNVHKENFMDSNVLNTLRVRASYGVVGNQNIGGAYIGQERISSFVGYQGQPAYAPSALVADDLIWEISNNTNIGIDFGLWDDRLTGSIDVYRNTSDNLFYNTPVSASTGFANVTRNVAGLQNQGIDLALSYDVVRGKDLNINLFVNAAINRTEITSLAPGQTFFQTGQTALQVGEALRSFYLVEWAGVNPATGKPLYRGVDGELTETFKESDRKFSDRNADPLWVGGFGTNITYKGFQLSTLFSFETDRWRTNGSLGILEDINLAGFANQAVSMLNAWQQPGDITATPSIASGSTRLLAHDRYLEDASFLRLRNATFSYSLQKNTLEKLNFMKAMRVYVQGTNLLTFSKWRGFDPESTFTSAFFDFPAVRQITFGLDITL